MSRLKRIDEKESTPHSIGFVMVDIDHFKQINDAFGHAAGDEVLRGMAQRFKSSVRQYDIVGRYGGEEFLVVLPHTDAGQLRGFAERLWEKVRSEPFHYDGHDISVTISLGVAAASGSDESHEELIRRADDALYRAKSEGRDRICYA